ncbi:unnamed protein product [Parnassius mnemosyne]|uniref:Odorant receptor n=1 Tax=Parnassius mnemosyne TaxID=213953 RepID=A0AAV1M670_9NEOP
MAFKHNSECFHSNISTWNIFGIWPKENSIKYYTFLSVVYAILTLITYNVILTINLFYTYNQIEELISEVIFYFNEVTIMSKAYMVIFKRKQIIEVLKILDCEEFKGTDAITTEIIQKDLSTYRTCYKTYNYSCIISFMLRVVVPIFVHLIWGNHLGLPISNYRLLNDEVREKYFVLCYLYQSISMYGHMMYNINVDTFIAGLIFLTITQLKVLKYNLNNLKVNANELRYSKEFQENLQVIKLKQCLAHYDKIILFQSSVQEISSITLFVMFGMASAIICVILCGFYLPSTTDNLIFMVTYLITMSAATFFYSWLGSQLIYESQELVFAAYSCEWIDRCQEFKRSVVILMEHAKIPLVMVGMKMFLLSLDTFITIVKSAFSLVTLIRSFQDEEDGS